MTDGIIKGTGNSRFLKGPADILSKYPTWEAAAAALAAGTFAVDLNGINAAGWTTQGTALNKANLLTDALCTALGLATTSTPTQAMEKLRQLIQSCPKTEVVSYVGTGTYGAGNPNSITFSFAPKVCIWIGETGVNNNFLSTYWNYTGSRPILVLSIITTEYTAGSAFAHYSNSSVYGKKSQDGRTITWYSNYYSSESYSIENQLNKNGVKQYILGIG